MYKKIILSVLVIIIITLYIINLKIDIFIRKNSINSFCQDNKYCNLIEKGLFSDKLKVKEHLKQNYPEIKYSKVIFETKNPEELRDIKLPKDFVLKSSSGSRMFQVVKDENYDIEKMIKKSKRFLSIKFSDYGYRKIPFAGLGEPHYNFNDNKIFIEEHLGDDIAEFRALTIKGNIIYYEIFGIDTKGSNRFTSEWDQIYIAKDQGYSISKNKNFEKPKNIEIVNNFIKKFYKETEIDFMRIDFYLKKDDFYFGEITFTPENCRWGYNKNFDDEIFKKYIQI